MFKRALAVAGISSVLISGTALATSPTAFAGDGLDGSATTYTTQPDITDRSYTKAEIDKIVKDNKRVKEVKSSPGGPIAMANGPVAGEPAFYLLYPIYYGYNAYGTECAQLRVYYNGIRNKARMGHTGPCYGQAMYTGVQIQTSDGNGYALTPWEQNAGYFKYYAGDVYTVNSQRTCINVYGWMDIPWSVSNPSTRTHVDLGSGPEHCG